MNRRRNELLGSLRSQLTIIRIYIHFRWRLMPRMLRGVKDRSMVTTKASWDGSVTSAPFEIAPTGLQKMAHEEGECATARGPDILSVAF